MRRAANLTVLSLVSGILLAGCGGEISVVEGEVKTIQVEMGGALEEVTYTVENGLAIMEGDIVLGDALELELERGAASAGVRSVGRLWPSCRVPYVIDSSAAGKKSSIMSAITHWQERTPIRFVARTTQTAYVKFSATQAACYSSIGRTGSAQTIMIGNGCGVGQIIHEIGHAVGLYHEQSRLDRDNHVRVLWANIIAGKEGNFQKYSSTTGRDLGSYDLGSVMHYGSYFFSSNGKPTLVRTDGSTFNVNRSVLSGGDIRGVNTLYSGVCN